VIKRFKFEELESAVLPIFPEFKWNKIKNKLVENHESFTIAHTTKIIDFFINVMYSFYIIFIIITFYSYLLSK
jgi:hypothetical protein